MEQVEVLDERGAVVDVVERAAMRARNLRHRSVYIAVFNRRDLLVHQRAAWKDIWPSRWDIAFGGVCAVGERWPDAAMREVAEELGATVGESELLDLGDGRFESEVVRVVGRVYAVQLRGPFTCPDGEVQRTEWLPLDALDAWLATHEVCDDSLELVVPRIVA